MIFLFFYWANRPKTYPVRNNTNLLSNLWLSAEVEPCSGLMTPSPASGAFWTFIYTFLFLSPLTRGMHGELDETFPALLRILDVFRCLFTSSLYSSCSLRPKCGFQNWCNQPLNSATAVAAGVLAAESGQEKQNAAAWRSCTILPWPFDKTQPSELLLFCRAMLFFFSPDFPKWKLLRQTEEKRKILSVLQFLRCATRSWILRIHPTFIRLRSTTCVLLFSPPACPLRLSHRFVKPKHEHRFYSTSIWSILFSIIQPKKKKHLIWLTGFSSWFNIPQDTLCH